ncbi:T9SS type A sorting domain-containing protein [Mesonia sp. MT50]|uniref:T9SS type A sorting domain-containing protein n=1 Tax=Mesonia profundi TaxID=3070998 RepID=A0ABU0ZZC4_9FLAO|nr:T9SS type A sorting domain-containing protein [Mesonia profundi]MDQ7916802.1 T9SS type A sorting domain-containing protein [Mesonia profundi]
MKKISLLLLLTLSFSVFAQENISFEESEGFTLGNINTQNDWEVTEGSDGILTNQVISDEQAQDGVFSFKNAYEPDYDFQWLPIFGAAKALDNPLSYENLTISYDILVTEQLGADFEFTAYAVNNEEFTPVMGIGVENQGQFYAIVSEDYDFAYIENVSWNANEWYTIKVEISSSEIAYYINNELVYTGVNFSQLDVSGINMLHNNYGGDAYYDNIILTHEDLSVPAVDKKSLVAYPNPVKNQIHIDLPSHEVIQHVEVISMTGQSVFSKSIANASIDLSSLEKGTYILKVDTNENTYRKTVLKE